MLKLANLAKSLEKATAAGAFAAAEIAELFLRGEAAFNCGCLQLQLPLTAAAFSCNWCLVFPISPLEIAPARFPKLQTGSRQNKNELQQLLLQKWLSLCSSPANTGALQKILLPGSGQNLVWESVQICAICWRGGRFKRRRGENLLSCVASSCCTWRRSCSCCSCWESTPTREREALLVWSQWHSKLG